MKYVIIGCGGVGSWLTPTLALLVKNKNVILIDGDTLEKKNLNRQLFSDRDIGKNKAEALGRMYGIKAIPKWYSPGIMEHSREDCLLVCVDNNTARFHALQVCDIFGCRAIVAANETHSSEAYVYLPEWRGTKLDPLVYYPEIISDQRNDPQRRSIGCTGEAQQANLQLVSANFMAAALAQHLSVLWTISIRSLDIDVYPNLPYRLRANLSRLEQSLIKDAEPNMYKNDNTNQSNPA